MTAKEIYELLGNAGVEYEVTEMFEGVRYIRVVVEEEESEE
jgi:hypothetical protein